MGRYVCAIAHCPEKSYERSPGVKFYKLKYQPQHIQKIWKRRILLMRTDVKKQSDLTDVCICSRHFQGGAKTKISNIPTIFPKKSDDGSITWPQNHIQIFPRKSSRRGLPPNRTPLSLNNNNNNNDGSGGTLSEKLEDLKRKECNKNNEPECHDIDKGEKSPMLSVKLRSLQAKQDSEPYGVPEIPGNVTEKEFHTCDKLAELERQLIEEKEKTRRLEQQLEIERFGLRRFMCSNEDFKFYTGLPDYFCFLAIFDFLNTDGKINYWGSTTKGNDPSYVTQRGKERSLSPADELFLTLNRLRQAYLEKDLAHRFHISESTVSRIFSTWINIMYNKFSQLPIWPSKNFVHSKLPHVFSSIGYEDTFLIVDCTEIFIEHLVVLALQSITFSRYKNHNTAKGLVGILPHGPVAFISDLYAGSVSDKELTKKCGLVEKFSTLSGVHVMADKGFEVQELFDAVGVRVNHPPFLKGINQMTLKQETETRRIARLRIHVERAIERQTTWGPYN
ncbi:uncharacterized protein [Ptychodera flava]|uniref:uncharacterized protein n=1 Tax=Ptychodera flava TaxID=63121 RepID=UPI00396AAE22